MKYVIFFIMSCFVYSNSVYGQETAQIVTIKKGDLAPFSGTLLNAAAAATMIAEKEFDKKRCDLDKEYELLKMRTTSDRDIGNVKIELDTANKKYTVITTLKDEEIKRLTDVAVTAEKKSNNYQWWTMLGICVGTITSVAIFFAVSYGSK
jgi:hypothetical protein